MIVVLQELVERISKLGVDYDEAHAKDMARLEKSNALLANFDPADFSYGVTAGAVVHKTTGAKLEDVPSAKDLDGADKAALQGYGRPYVDGKPGRACQGRQGECDSLSTCGMCNAVVMHVPGGVYYRFPRPPQPLPLLGVSTACCSTSAGGCTAA